MSATPHDAARMPSSSVSSHRVEARESREARPSAGGAVAGAAGGGAPAPGSRGGTGAVEPGARRAGTAGVGASSATRASAAAASAARVGDGDDRRPQREPAQRVHDDRLGPGVQVRRRLVDQHQRAGRHHGPGQGEPGPLPGREVLTVLADRRLQTAREARDDVAEPDAGEGLPEVGVGRVRPPDGQRLPHRAVDQPRSLRHPAHLAAPPAQRGLVEQQGAGAHPAGLRWDLAGEHGQQGGLAGPRRAGHGDQAGRWEGQAARQVQGRHGTVRVGDPHVLQAYAGPGRGGRRARRQRDRSPARGRGVEQLESPGQGRRTLGGRVELRPDPAQRPVGLGGEQQHHQGDRELHRPGRQPEPHGHRDEGDRERRHQLEHRGRREREPQGGQGGAAVGVRHPADRAGLGGRAAVHDQRGQAAHHVHEVPGQAAQGLPLPLRPVTGGEPHEGREDGDEGQGHGDDAGREQVLGRDRDERQRGQHHGQHQGRQVPRQVGVDRGDAPRDQQRQLAAPLPRHLLGRQVEGRGDQPPAQVGGHAGRRAGRAQVAHEHRRGPGGERQQGEGGRGRQQVALPADDDHHQVGDRERLRDQQAAADDPGGDQTQQGPAGRSQQRQETWVQGSHRAVGPVAGRSRSSSRSAGEGGVWTGMWWVAMRLRNTQ